MTKLGPFAGGLVVGLGIGYAWAQRSDGHPTAQRLLESPRADVAAVVSTEVVRQAADSVARVMIRREVVRADAAESAAKAAGQIASELRDSALAMVARLVADSAARDSLTRRILAADSARRAAADTLLVALEAAHRAREEAERRWAVADSSARAATEALHRALRRLETVTRMTRRCGIGGAAGYGVTTAGAGPGLVVGVSCRR